MASLDVESFFTNVSVEAIETILDRVYRDGRYAPLEIPERTLKRLLLACTKETPFYCTTSEMYVQVDGAAKGSPLGPLLANLYLGTVEEKVFRLHRDRRLEFYCRYVDDIFLNFSAGEHLKTLKNAFEAETCLKFTHEANGTISLHFLMSQENGMIIFSARVFTSSRPTKSSV